MTRALVGLLTTRGHPLLPYLLERAASAAELEPVLLFDAKDFSAKDAAIFQERTQGAFPPRPLLPHQSVDVSDHNGEDCRAIVRARGIPLLVNAGTPRRIRAELMATAPVLNVHPGILPRYRGASCCEWAIHNDDPVGVSAHFMDEGLDSGPVVFTRELAVRRGQTYTEVRVALYRLWFGAVVDAIGDVLRHGLSPATLPPQPAGEAFKPIPEELFVRVKEKLARGEYPHAH